MTDAPDLEIIPADFDDAFDDWLAGSSLTRVSVTIYGNGEAVARYQTARDRWLALTGGEENVEKALAEGDGAEAADARTEMIAAFEAREASKAEWILEDISGRVDEIRDSLPKPPVAPVPPAEPELRKGASDVDRRSHTVKMQQFREAMTVYEADVEVFEKAAEEWNTRYGYATIASAVVEVRLPDGRVVTEMSPERIEATAKSIGALQVQKLNRAVASAMLEEQVVTAPFSRSDSDDIPE